MSVKTITLSEDVSAWVEQEAATRQMSADEFVSQLAREAWNRAHSGRADDKAELERLLLEAVNSDEPAQPLDASWWKTVHAGVEARLQEQETKHGTCP